MVDGERRRGTCICMFTKHFNWKACPDTNTHFLLNLKRRWWVFFFEKNDCFYSKAFPKYSITSYKRKILQEFARELGTECEFIKIYNEFILQIHDILKLMLTYYLVIRVQ